MTTESKFKQPQTPLTPVTTINDADEFNAICILPVTPSEDCSLYLDIRHIISYMCKYGKHPASGAPLKQEDLVPLTFHKNSQGEYHCPVLKKVFTEFTHIVAIKTTGNVFSYEAIADVNLKTQNWMEPLTDEPFKREDIITIQNPKAIGNTALVEVEDEEHIKTVSDPTHIINMKGDKEKMLKEHKTEKGWQLALHAGGASEAQNERAAREHNIYKPKSESDVKSQQPALIIVDAASPSVHGKGAAAPKAASSDKTAARMAMHMSGYSGPVNAEMAKSRYTSGATSRSLTSTSYDPVTKNEFEDVKIEKNPKKKCYVQLHTTHGDLNIELHCDITPRACENFITLCEHGYYNGVVFHRNIRNFMIQGGDPTGTGKGGESIWGKPFKDEINSKLLHSGRGVVSMANNGPHTNGSQFFILYKSATHLNFKHTVFGQVVGGLKTLSVMEKVAADEDDRPLEEIMILSASVHGRSPAAAKAASRDKTVARKAIHMSGDRRPVSSKMVNRRYTSGATSRSFTPVSYGRENLSDAPFKREYTLTNQSPSTIGNKTLVEFDHVKKNLKAKDEEHMKTVSDPTYNMNVKGDIKKRLKVVNTKKGHPLALHGGGGDKAQNERAARKHIKDKAKSESEVELQQLDFGIIDAASASVHGTSETAAPTAMHMSGDLSHAVAKMVNTIDESNHGEKVLVIHRLTIFLDKIISRGSNTIVYEGELEFGKPVAVKRIKKAFIDVYLDEIRNFRVTLSSLNTVDYYGHEEDDDFIYVAMERYDLNLHELVKTKKNTHAKLFTQNEYPSLDLLKLTRKIVIAVACLHSSDIIHGDLKPQNVVLSEKLCLRPKLFRIGRRSHLVTCSSSSGRDATGTLGCRAPEQSTGQLPTLAMDMYSLGCVLFFCVTQGEYPHVEREIDLTDGQIVDLSLVKHNYEAMDLFTRLLHRAPHMRPKTLEVLIHPLFWDSRTRIWFLRDVAGRLESKDEKTYSLIATLEKEGLEAFPGTWDMQLESELISQIRKASQKKYRYDKVLDLLDFIDDTTCYYRCLRKDTRNLLGPMLDGVDNYFRKRFPKLLVALYDVMSQHCYKEDWFRSRVMDMYRGHLDVFKRFENLPATDARFSPEPQQSSSSTV